MAYSLYNGIRKYTFPSVDANLAPLDNPYFTNEVGIAPNGKSRLYNIAGTDYEALDLYWASNIANIITSRGTTAQTLRQLRIGAGSSTMLFSDGTQPFLNLISRSSPNGGSFIVSTPTLTSTTNNIQRGIMFAPNIQQSGTAGFNCVTIAPFIETVGSGLKYLLNIGVGDTTNGTGTVTPYVTIDHLGNTVFTKEVTVPSATVGTSAVPLSQLQTLTYKGSGQNTQSGNGTSTSFTITHGLSGISSTNKVLN